MPLSEKFYSAVNANDVRGVRIMMKNSLLADPTFEEFAQMESASRSMPGLYDQHNGKELILDKSKWTDDYMNSQMVQVVHNFSHERLDHLKSVVRHLRPVTSRSSAAPRVSSRPANSANRNMSFKEQMERDKANGTYIGSGLATGAVIGGIAGGVTGGFVAVAASTILGGAAIGVAAGAVVGGAVGFVIGNKGD